MIAVDADPVFNPDDPRIRRDTQSVTRPASVDSAGRRLPRLPFGEQEGRCAMSGCPRGACRVFSGFAANRLLLEDGSLGDYRYVDLSTHAVIGPVPETSGIYLSLVNRQGAPADGFVTLSDLYHLPPMRSDVVAVSACQTAAGRNIAGEGLMNFARAFEYAHVPNVLVTLWPINDESSAEFMCRFLGSLTAGGNSPSAALLEARRAVAGQWRWRDPAHWAAFSLVGLGRGGVKAERAR
jgi:CHAT domain-containing protein